MKGVLELTADAYTRAFEQEKAQAYPVVDALEASLGYALERQQLLAAARVLACPVKANPPNWQHGRVLYAVTRHYLEGYRGRVLMLDIGTAKGFSALCLLWAMQDAGVHGKIVSVDVIDPKSRERRNTVAELEAPKTLFEILTPWPEASGITFQESTGVDFLLRYTGRIEVAFVDGKHTGETVAQEGLLLSQRQQPGDVVVFDDVHLAPVRAAVESLARAYDLQWLQILPQRAYAIGRRK